MKASKKLSPGHQNVLRLIRKGEGADGWAPVSKQVAPIFAEKEIPGGAVPAELCEFEYVGDDGRGRARLTDEGNAVLDAMGWL
jgi:hypothetical protein